VETTNIIASVSTVIAAISVIYGVGAWRREHVGRRRIELAEEVLALFYEARDAIAFIRSPMGYTGEGSTRERGDDETEDERRILDNAYVVFERYKKTHEVFNKIESLKYRFVVQFGETSLDHFLGLRKIVNQIFSSARMLSNLWLEQQQAGRFENSVKSEKIRESINKCEGVFWEMPDDKDEIKPKVNAIVEQIDELCRAVIQMEPWWKRVLQKVGLVSR
jgi:hypothetical protein